MGTESKNSDTRYLGLTSSVVNNIYPQTADMTLQYGASASNRNRMDIKWFGATSSDYLFLDSSKSEIQQAGAMRFNPSGGPVVLFDDFLGDLIGDEWDVDVDTSCTINLAGAITNGAATLTTDTTDERGCQLTHGIQWLASNTLVFECRFKIDVITTVRINAGFSDAVETTTTIACQRDTVTVTSTASNCVLFVYDTDSTTDKFFGIGVKADVDTAQIGDTIAPVAATWMKLRIEITAAGTASFFIDGVAYGSSVANAVTTTTKLTPYFAIQNATGTAHVCDLDFIYCASLRS